jgi:RNase P subunit RPR2
MQDISNDMVYINLVDRYCKKCITIMFVMYTFFSRILQETMCIVNKCQRACGMINR